MVVWHLVSFSFLASLLLFFIFPFLFLLFVYLLLFESSFILEWSVFSFEGLSFLFPFMLDKMSLVFSCVVVVISFSVFLFSVSYMSGEVNLEYFVYMVVLFVLSMNFLIFIPHLFFLLLGWDGLGLTSYLLVIYYQNDKSLSAGIITLMSNRVGDSLFILAICWCFIGGCWSLGVFFKNFVFFSMVCILFGSMTKSAQIPFSAWLPAAMAAPTPVSSLVHSSTLVTAGVYVLVRFYSSFMFYDCFCYVVFYVGVLTCLMASLSAVYENDLKKVVAFSTLSQLGVMFMGLGLGFPVLSFFHLVTHALFKALLFVCAGNIIHCMLNNQDMRLMGNLWVSLPMTCVALNVANFALCGFPFMAGFYSKDLIVESFLYSSFPISTSFLLVFSVVLTGAYSLRLCFFTLWSSYKGSGFLVLSDESVFVCFSFFILLFGAVFGGGFFFWILFPFVGVMVIPFYLKIMVLFFLVFLGVFCYFFLYFNFLWFFSYFMGSMWFLVFLSSFPLVSRVFSFGLLFYVQEFTWMEVFSGKGLVSFMSFVSSFLQEGHNFSFSKMFSLFTLFFGLFLIFY